MGRSRRGDGILREFLLGRLRGERGPLPHPLVASHFSSLSLEGQFCAFAPALIALPRRLALPVCLAVLAMGAGLERPLGSYLWTTRPDALFIGMGVAALRKQAVAPGKLWPSLSLGQAVYWACVASLLARLAIGRFSGLGLTFVAVLFGFVLAGRLGADAGEVLAREGVA